jgi:hypothetical protein
VLRDVRVCRWALGAIDLMLRACVRTTGSE